MELVAVRAGAPEMLSEFGMLYPGVLRLGEFLRDVLLVSSRRERVRENLRAVSVNAGPDTPKVANRSRRRASTCRSSSAFEPSAFFNSFEGVSDGVSFSGSGDCSASELSSYNDSVGKYFL